MQKEISQPWAALASNLVSETWIWGGETCWCSASLGEIPLPLESVGEILGHPLRMQLPSHSLWKWSHGTNATDSQFYRIDLVSFLQYTLYIYHMPLGQFTVILNGWLVFIYLYIFLIFTIYVSLHGKQMGKQWKQCQTLFFWVPKSLQMVTAATKLKDAYSLEGKL